MRFVVLAALLFLVGCGALSLRPRNPDHAARKAEIVQRLGVDAPTLDATLVADKLACDKLDNTVTGFTATTVVLGVLSGGSGLTSIFTDNTSRYVTGGIGVGLAASTALFTYLATTFSSRYARNCAVNLGGK